MSSKTTGYKLTKADLRQINIRNLVGFQAGWNYERMQHSGYLWIILPQLRKIYGDNTEALKTACRTQCSPFFNRLHLRLAAPDDLRRPGRQHGHGGQPARHLHLDRLLRGC